MTNKLTILILLVFLVLLPAGCGQEQSPEPVPPEEELELTLEELEAYNGKDGNPAYVAVEGIVYDVSGSSLWKDGEHNGFQAGNDLTDAIISKSPHGTKTLERMPRVGRIVP